jgi:putative serine protease PepD
MTETPDNRASDPADQPAEAQPAQPAAPEQPPAVTEPRAETPESRRQPEAAAARQAEPQASEATTPLPAAQPQAAAPVHPYGAVPPAQPPGAPVWGAPAPQWAAPPPQFQSPPGAPAAASPQQSAWGMPAPGTPGNPPPNWAMPAPAVLPPYGAPDAGTGHERKRPAGRMALIVALVAGLVGGGVGAGITYAVHGNSTTTSSLTGAASGPSSNSLNTGSPNANAVTSVAAKILPSVVTISVVNNSDGTGDEGSGIIISSNGEILTNNHVVAAAASSTATMTVVFAGGKITPAKIVGRDQSSDLAVIQANGVTGLTPASLGDSSTVAVGQNVVAVGAPLGLSNTVTTGIVSALDRPVLPSSQNGQGNGGNGNAPPTALNAIQTDASINPGNSGGPLVDMTGRVIGINSAIATASNGSFGGSQSGSIGLGFAIPINQAKWIADELITTGSATHSLLGVKVADPGTSATQAGAVITSVTPGGPADKAGVKSNDVVVKVNDQQIASADSLVAAIRSFKPGTSVTLTYVRGGQTATTTVTLTSATPN